MLVLNWKGQNHITLESLLILHKISAFHMNSDLPLNFEEQSWQFAALDTLYNFPLVLFLSSNCLICLFRKQTDEWPSLFVSRREKLEPVPGHRELQPLASWHCLKPLPARACLYHHTVKTTLLECQERLVSPFILAVQINTLKQKILPDAVKLHPSYFTCVKVQQKVRC